MGRNRRPTGTSRIEGSSLIEVIVAMAVSALLALALFAILRFSHVIWTIGASDVDVQRMAGLALETMTRELREASAHPDHLKVWPGGVQGRRQDAIGFVSARDARQAFRAPDGEPSWQRAIYYVYDPVRREIRKRTGDLPLREPVLDATSRDSGAGLPLAWNIDSLALDVDGDLVTIVVVAERHGRLARVQTQVRPRN